MCRPWHCHGVASAYFWLPQLVFLSSLCWTTGLFWLVTAYARRRSSWSLCGIAFCFYSLLVAGYPVLIVLFGYLLAPYTLLALAGQGRPLRQTVFMAGNIVGAVLVGVAAASPVYLDLFHAANQSARVIGSDDAFFLNAFPRFTSTGDISMFLAGSLDPSALGGLNVMPYPQCTNGVALSPLVVLLVAIAIALDGVRPVRFWLIAVAALFLLNISSGAYLFAVHHMGLGMSRCRTCWGALIPLSMLAGIAVEYVLRQGASSRERRRVWMGFAGGAGALGVFYSSLLLSGMHPAYSAIAAAVIIAIALGLLIGTRSPLGNRYF